MELELKMNEAAREFLHDALYEICQRIEKCGASVELTNAVTLASDLRSAVGNQHNPPDQYAAQRVLEALQRAAPAPPSNDARAEATTCERCGEQHAHPDQPCGFRKSGGSLRDRIKGDDNGR